MKIPKITAQNAPAAHPNNEGSTVENYTTIRRFNTKNFSVIVDATYDEDADTSYMDAEDLEAFYNKGGASYLVRCRVMLHGAEIATDYLGGCAYYDIDEFQKDAYFAQMVKTACAEARKELNSRGNVKLRNAA